MPFFCNNILKFIKSVTLQVRILKFKKFFGRKRAAFSVSASLTLEAALVLPLFLYAGVILMMPFRIMDTELQVQAVAERTSEAIGEGAYMSRYGKQGSVWNTAVAHAYAEMEMRIRLRNFPIQNVSLLRSSLLEDGETIDLILDYEVKMPFSVFAMSNVKQTVRSCRRAWVGVGGQKGAGKDQGEDDVIVYVGKNSTRYHISSTCHYLYNHLSSVSVSDIGNRKNQNGSSYSPCKRCGNSAASTVYIMPSGRHYHTTTSCSAINAYTKAVLKSEVEYLGVCSYCSRKKERGE